jgi:hypothetical protein
MNMNIRANRYFEGLGRPIETRSSEGVGQMRALRLRASFHGEKDPADSINPSQNPAQSWACGNAQRRSETHLLSLTLGEKGFRPNQQVVT